MEPTPPTINLWVIEDVKSFRENLVYFIDHTPHFNCLAQFEDLNTVSLHLESDFESPDVILIDIGLPEISGIEGISLLKAAIPEGKIVMLTVEDAPELIYKAFYAGASGYLLKGVPNQHILKAIRETYDGGMLMPPVVAQKVQNFFKENYSLVENPLSQREKDVLRLIADGKKRKVISEKLFISIHTVNSHLKNIYEKLHVKSGSEAVAKALREKFI